MTRKWFSIVAAFSMSAASYGWGDTGHKVVAAVAWRLFTRRTQIEVAHILMHGDTISGSVFGRPFTHTDSISPVPDDQLTDAFLDSTVQPVFIQAATWPDDLKGGRSRGFETRVKALNDASPNIHHVAAAEASRCKSWHFLDLPIVPATGAATHVSTVMAGNVAQHPYDDSNAAYALTSVLFPMVQRVDSSADPGPNDAAMALFFVEHIVGDLHQPLHCESFYSPEHPNGDKGGNDIPFTEKELHAYWDHGVDHAIKDDAGLQGETDPSNVAGAWLLDVSLRPSRAQIDDLDPLHWAKAGRDLAIKVAYNHLTASATPSYRTAQVGVCKRQIVLAGYRLAHFLKTRLGV